MCHGTLKSMMNTSDSQFLKVILFYFWRDDRKVHSVNMYFDSLLSYNLYTVEFIFMVYSLVIFNLKGCISVTRMTFWNSPSSTFKILLNSITPFLPTTAQGNHQSAFCPFSFAHTSHFIGMGSYSLVSTIWIISAQCFQNSLML